MYTCASCTIHACKDPEHKDMPKNCPMRQEALVEEAKAEYQKPEVQKFFVTSSEIEHDGYCQWPRLKETMVFCKRMGYKKIGLSRRRISISPWVSAWAMTPCFTSIRRPGSRLWWSRTASWPITRWGPSTVRTDILRTV